jgi:hypothetical protein
MTLNDMKANSLMAASLIAALAASPVIVVAQTGQAVGTAAKAITRVVPPTGPVSAITKAANLVRASRAAAIKATGNAGAAAATGGLSRVTSVVGYLWTSQDGVIGNATVQLRNTVTGAVVGTVKSDAVGQFLFTNVDSGEYAIEYVTDGAKNIIALGQPFTAAPGEVVTTFVRIANQIPVIVPDLATNVAASAVQTAATAGVTTVITPLAPVTQAPPPPGPPPIGLAPPVVTIPPSVSSPIR